MPARRPRDARDAGDLSHAVPCQAGPRAGPLPDAQGTLNGTATGIERKRDGENR